MRYYSTMRPLSSGTYPTTAQVPTNIVNFDGKKYCEQIGREAWGYIEYESPLAETVAQHYDLVQEGMYIWHSVTVTYRNGKLRKIKHSGTEENSQKPMEHDVKFSGGKGQIVVKWFRTYEEAEAYFNKVKEENYE